MINYKICILILALTASTWCEEETTTAGTCKEGTDEYCALCTSDKCTVCFASYINEDGVCTEPTTKVEYCASYSGATACSGCLPKYNLVSNKCEAVTVANCLVSDGTKCTTCDGSHKTDDDTMCTGSACTVENCASCKTVSEKEECQLCSAGYLLATDKLSCTKLEGAKEGCNIVSDACSSCYYGFYVNSASSVTPMTCKASSRYSSVKTIGISMMALLAAFLRLN